MIFLVFFCRISSSLIKAHCLVCSCLPCCPLSALLYWWQSWAWRKSYGGLVLARMVWLKARFLSKFDVFINLSFDTDPLSSHSFSLPSATLGDHEGILYVTFGRLTVGWAWQTFFTGAVAAFLPSSELSSERSRMGLALLLKVVIATLVGYLGYRLELYLSQRKAVKQHAYEISMQQRARIDLIEGDEASSTAGMSQNLL